MDAKKTGILLAQVRREKGMTQSQLAEKLCVTDKAISRWETGKGFPEISLLQAIGNALDLSVTEILNGERFSPEQVGKQSDQALLSALQKGRMQIRRTSAGFLFFLCVFFWTFGFLYTTGDLVFSFFIAGALFLLTGIGLLLPIRFNSAFGRCIRKKSSALSVCILAAAVLLEFLPGGVGMYFADGPFQSIRRTFSYFNLIPVGYGNIFPFFTAVFTIFLLVFTCLRLILKKPADGPFFLCSGVLFILLALIPLILFGFKTITWISGALLILWILFTTLQMIVCRKK